MIKQALDRRHAQDRPIQVGFIGAGRMGTGALCQIGLMRGIRNAVISDLSVERAKRAFALCGYDPEQVVVTNDAGKAADAIRAQKAVVTEDAQLLPRLPVDVVVDATGSPELGARIALDSIQCGKHIVMLNVETDVVVGPVLHRMAESAGVCYTVSSGDEPGLIAEFYDRYAALGFEIVAVGKAPSSIAKFDRYATPENLAEEARELGVNPHFLTTFRDATKTMIEMACISNYTGLVADIRGMHGPVAGVNDIAKLFRPKSEGGILNRRGVVDYARPVMKPDGGIDFDLSVTPGVFLCVYTDHPQIREDLKYLDVTGSDGYYTMYTPYHLVTNEIPLSIVNAVEFRHPTVVPKLGLVTEVFSAAKRTLKAGELLDGGGGSTVYALNDDYEVARAEGAVPLGLLPGAKLKRDIPVDAVVTYDVVELKTDTVLYQLRKLQEAGFGSRAPAAQMPMAAE